MDIRNGIKISREKFYVKITMSLIDLKLFKIGN